MRSWKLYKLIKRTGNSENGFVLIVALIAILILIAIGFFALTTISGDLMITYRLVGERKALLAAESGAYVIAAKQSTCYDDNGAVAKTSVDSGNDPHASYSAAAAVRDPVTPSVILPGNSWPSAAWYVDVTGTDSDYNSTVTIRVGLADESTPGTPSHDTP
jgi:hypothetical protein